jgi:hypothetical protein
MGKWRKRSMNKTNVENQGSVLSGCFGRLIESLKDKKVFRQQAEEGVSLALKETSKSMREEIEILKENKEKYDREMKQYEESILEGSINE